MSKKVVKIIRLQIVAGKANPAPPIGPALGSAGINIMAFCKEFNAKTQDRSGDILPTVITVYGDKSFSFITKEPPASALIKKQLGLEKGSPEPHCKKVGTLKREDIEKIIAQKRSDMSVGSDAAAFKCIAGTARSMGIVVEG